MSARKIRAAVKFAPVRFVDNGEAIRYRGEIVSPNGTTIMDRGTDREIDPAYTCEVEYNFPEVRRATGSREWSAVCCATLGGHMTVRSFDTADEAIAHASQWVTRRFYSEPEVES